MATTATNLRSRRSEAQLHALNDVQRHIRAVDPSARRKYLREFNEVFDAYRSVISPTEMKELVASSDVVLVGDYHALPACQNYAAALIEDRAHPGDRPVVLAVETIFSRDQHIVDEWWRREISDDELRQRIRFDLDWGYDWAPFHRLLVTAREHAEAIYGLDCIPREDLRKIGTRDRHAAHKLTEIRRRHPEAVIVVLFGESHLAPSHLPRLLSQRMPGERRLNVLQNIDALYWKAAGEQQERVDAVRIDDSTVCVFNATPLEKYESYRLHLSSLGRAEGEGPDLAPTVYNLVDTLLRMLNVKLHASHNGIQPVFLVDLLPEVCTAISEARLRRILLQEDLDEAGMEALLEKLEEHGSAYLPRSNVFYVREFRLMYAAEEATRFVHRACRGELSSPGESRAIPYDSEDAFYAQVLEHALAYWGARILHPARVESESVLTLTRRILAEQAKASGRASAQERDVRARRLGYALGSDLYRRYLDGTVSKIRLRRLFFLPLAPGEARKACFDILRTRGPARKPPQPDHTGYESLRNAVSR